MRCIISTFLRSLPVKAMIPLPKVCRARSQRLWQIVSCGHSRAVPWKGRYDSGGCEQVIDKDTADAIMYELTINRYIDKKGALTDKYYEEKANGTLKVAEEVADCAASVMEIIDSIYDPKAMQPENARSNNVELQVDEEKLAMPEFKALWSKINAKSVYIVDFDIDELVQKAIASLDAKLRVAKIFFKVESGVMEEIKSKETLEAGTAFVKEASASYGTNANFCQ